jgi:hypothetical protein
MDNRLAEHPQIFSLLDGGVGFGIKKIFFLKIVYIWPKFPPNPFLISENGKRG